MTSNNLPEKSIARASVPKSCQNGSQKLVNNLQTNLSDAAKPKRSTKVNLSDAAKPKRSTKASTTKAIKTGTPNDCYEWDVDAMEGDATPVASVWNAMEGDATPVASVRNAVFGLPPVAAPMARFKPAVLKEAKCGFFIEYYALNMGNLDRCRVKLNVVRKRFSSLPEFRKYANSLCENINLHLMNGWSPFAEKAKRVDIRGQWYYRGAK